MHIAVLFNSDHPKYSGSYGWKIRDTILSTNVIQSSNRHVKVKAGDVLIYSHSKTKQKYYELSERVYLSHPWKMLKEQQLRDTFMKATVFAWTIQNIDENSAKKLHKELVSDDAYLGIHGIDLSNPLHLVFYRNLMISMYRIKGRTCRVFYSMGNEDERDQTECDSLLGLGFTDVDWENRGAHGTIFDDYDTSDHFSKVEAFRSLASRHIPGGDNEADELILLLEDLNPRLFITLSAIAYKMENASHEEDIAQAGISARRYIEQLADVLYSPREELRNGRQVTKDKFRNRIWAYIDESLPNNEEKSDKLNSVGQEVDRVLEEVNAAVHGNQTRERFERTLSDLASLSVALLQLNPDFACNPYFAFQDNMSKFLEEVINRSAS